MTYNPATDFLALWRNIAGQVSKVEMPGLDYVIAALARAGIISLTVANTAPVANQATTAWLKTAVPSNSAEGQFFLWDKITTQYLAATPALFLQFLEAGAGQNGVSWWTSVGGPPLNTVGNDGDFAIRTDAPNGIYGPKTGGAWPASPIPGTADVITSTALDNTFGSTPGQVIFRGNAAWQALAIGAEDTILTSLAGFPAWDALSALMDVVFGNVQGSILYRDAGVWNDLAPGMANQVLSSGGPAANPQWSPRTAEFASGTVLLFYQSTAPTGWTKQTTINDCGLRVTSGGTGGNFTAGSAFSTVFAQSVVGDTTLSVAQMPSHGHSISPTVITLNGSGVSGYVNSGLSGTASVSSTQNIGGGSSHNHSINLTLSYADVIIAVKN